jgi:hypothetical protein
MENKVNKETIKLFFEKLAHFINYIFPGLFILELFFHKGFFSNQPETLIGGILFGFWCIIFSIPYHFIQPFSVENIFINLELESINKKIIKEGDFSPSEDELEDLQAAVELGFILLKILLTYFIYKFICYYFVFDNYFDIDQNIWKFLLTITSMITLSYPFGYIYSATMKFYFIKYLTTKLKQHR